MLDGDKSVEDLNKETKKLNADTIDPEMNDQSPPPHEERSNDLLNDSKEQNADLDDLEYSESPLPGLEIRSEIALDQQNIPDLTLSREQTPDTDFYDDEAASTYSELAQGTPQPEETHKRPAGGLLDTNRAVKRTNNKTELVSETSGVQMSKSPSYDPENPAGVKEEKIRRRVAAKVIDKFWMPLDNEAFHSFENLCNISLNKVLERYDGLANPHTKVEETQRVILNSWLSTRHPRSFLARLQMTKLPPLKSLQVRMKGVKTNSQDSLNIDLVIRQKKVSESYLLAELEQLKSLETFHKNLKAMYELDAKYLQDFKKSTSALQAEHAQEKQAKMAELHLEASGAPLEDISFLNKPSLTLKKSFNPNTDSDVLQILQDLDRQINASNVPTKKLLDLCDQLDSIYSKLNSGKLKSNKH